MKSELSCPVCGYTEISGNACPNCDTDLSLIRLLKELPPSSPQVTQPEPLYRQSEVEQVCGVARFPQNLRAGWQVGVALLLLMVGIGLGAVGSFLFLQPPQLLSKTVNSSSPVTVSGDKTPSLIAQAPINQQPTQYTVKPGDNLTVITQQFCGKGKSWQVMVQANPQLTGRENWINVGEMLKLPNCEG